MKDRMIIIREKVVFIIAVSHDKQEVREESKPDVKQQNVHLPIIEINAN